MTRSGMKFVCEGCPCGNARLSYDDICVISECEHCKIFIHNSEVVRIESKGRRD